MSLSSTTHEPLDLQATTTFNETIISSSNFPSKIAFIHPLQLFDQVLMSIMMQREEQESRLNRTNNDNNCDPLSQQVSNSNSNSNSNNSSSNNSNSIDEDEILERIIKTIDFLYGDDSASLIEGTLSILDQSNNCHHYYQTSGPRGSTTPVRLVRSATSNRQMFVVQGGSSNTDGTPKEYQCLLGIPYSHTSLIKSNKLVGRYGYHCTCRSFHNRSSRGDSGFEICKHLLAARIAPALQNRQQSSSNGNTYYVEEDLSDDEYTQLAIQTYNSMLT